MPKSKEYWQKFCDDEEKRLIRVRHSFPKLSFFPNVSNCAAAGLRDTVDSNVSPVRVIEEKIPLVNSKSLLFNTPDVSSVENGENVQPNLEPIVKISPPTPLKRPMKNNVAAIVDTSTKEQYVSVVAENKFAARRASSYVKSQFHDIPSENSVVSHDGSGNGKVYSKSACPFHRYEPAVKIFDDNIEKYLIDDPRAASALPNKKFNELPRNTSNKYGRTENEVTSVKSKKIQKVAFPRDASMHRSDNVADLTADEVASVEFKDEENNTLNKQRNFESEIRNSQSNIITPNLRFPDNKKSRKQGEAAKDLKVITSFPRLQIRNGDETISDGLITKSQKYSRTCKIRDGLIEGSK